MKKIITLVLVTVLLAFKSFACANYYYALDNEGHIKPLGYDWLFRFNKNFNIEFNVNKLKKLEKKLIKDKNYMLLSDYAVGLMKLGKQKEALEILIELYRHYPNDYKIAANLGTAYELNGQVDSALKYIKRDMLLNPNDHEGSEWIHVKVLETKLALKKNAEYLKNHTVLNLTEKQKSDSVVLEHLTIQLDERVPFTPGPDEIMASLFTDLGDISANVKSIEYAKAYYQIAMKYYGSKSPALDLKIKDMEKLMKKYAGLKLKPDHNFEGSQNRITHISYQKLLKDNDEEHYKINWGKLTINVDSLLALVDFSKTSKVIRSTEKGQAEELRLIPEPKVSLTNPEKDSTGKKYTHGRSAISEKVNPFIYFLFLYLFAGLWYFMGNKSKREAR